MATSEAYLKAILGMIGRQAFPAAALADLVAPKGSGEKQLAAYNLCDGEHTQSEIASAVHLDKANLNKTIARWVELGIMFRTNNGGEIRPVHIYSLSKDQFRKTKGRKNGD